MTKFERILTEMRVCEFLQNLETLDESQAAEVIANLDAATIETINEVVMARGVTPKMARRSGLTVLPKGRTGQVLDEPREEDNDINNDGVVNDADKYLLHRREVRRRAIEGRK
jgi:hypothetical protein